MELNWRNGQLHLPLKFSEFRKTDAMYLFVRAAVGYALAFVNVKTLETDGVPVPQDMKCCTVNDTNLCDKEDEQKVRKTVKVAYPRERIERAMEVQERCRTAMAATYARLVLHCSNFEHHKEDERFFECVYFYVCSVVKLGVAAEYWRTVEEELGFLFRGAHFSTNIKLHATTAYSNGPAIVSSPGLLDSQTASHSHTRSRLGGGGSISTDVVSSASSKIIPVATTQRLVPTTGTNSFKVPTSCIVHFAPSVPVRRLVAECGATRSRAAHNIELSHALRGRMCIQRSEGRRRQLGAAMSPRFNLPADLQDATDSEAPCTQRILSSPRLGRKNIFTTRSPALNHLLPATEERVKLALQGYEQELQEHRDFMHSTGKDRGRDDNVLTQSKTSVDRELWRK